MADDASSSSNQSTEHSLATVFDTHTGQRLIIAPYSPTNDSAVLFRLLGALITIIDECYQTNYRVKFIFKSCPLPFVSGDSTHALFCNII